MFIYPQHPFCPTRFAVTTAHYAKLILDLGLSTEDTVHLTNNLLCSGLVRVARLSEPDEPGLLGIELGDWLGPFNVNYRTVEPDELDPYTAILARLLQALCDHGDRLAANPEGRQRHGGPGEPELLRPRAAVLYDLQLHGPGAEKARWN